MDNENGKCQIIDFAVRYDASVNYKETETIEKYQNLARELKKLWHIIVEVISVVMGAFG